MQVGNRFFKCWFHAGHGRTNVIDALKVSCDVYFYDLSMKMKLEDFKDYVLRCMLGHKTGIDLPNERNGLSQTWNGIIIITARGSAFSGTRSISPLARRSTHHPLANLCLLFRHSQ
jgi:cell division protein FtsI/penicillin-binding protein 2